MNQASSLVLAASLTMSLMLVSRSVRHFRLRTGTKALMFLAWMLIIGCVTMIARAVQG